jgi:release factor glutamine methyltransferase
MRSQASSTRTAHHAPVVSECLRHAVLTLQAAKIETASLDARLLLQEALGLSREQLLLAMERPMPAGALGRYEALLTRRSAREPVAKILGRREFYGLEFAVTQATLDPRPDSETVVDAVLTVCADRQKPYRILDLGTGTGCLCLSLLKALPNASAVAVDVSDAALAVAQQNAQQLGLSSRVQFVASRWCDAVDGVFDVIVSNPPYIPRREIDDLALEVASFEPRLALDGGEDGLDCYREIMVQLPARLAKGALAVFEIGLGQHDALARLAEAQGLSARAMHKDLGGIIRAVTITNEGRL